MWKQLRVKGIMVHDEVIIIIIIIIIILCSVVETKKRMHATGDGCVEMWERKIKIKN